MNQEGLWDSGQCQLQGLASPTQLIRSPPTGTTVLDQGGRGHRASLLLALKLETVRGQGQAERAALSLPSTLTSLSRRPHNVGSGMRPTTVASGPRMHGATLTLACSLHARRGPGGGGSGLGTVPVGRTTRSLNKGNQGEASIQQVLSCVSAKLCLNGVLVS